MATARRQFSLSPTSRSTSRFHNGKNKSLVRLFLLFEFMCRFAQTCTCSSCVIYASIVPSLWNFFFFFFFLNKRIHLAWSSWLTKLPVLGAFRPFGNEPDQQVEQWNMPVSECGISVCLHLKHHLPLWNLTNASKKKKKTHTKKTFAGRRHESSSCLTLFKVAYKSWDAQYITLKLLLGLL